MRGKIFLRRIELRLSRIPFKKWTMYLVGFAVFTAGIPFLTHARLGLSPWDSGLMGLYYFTGLPVTLWSNVFAVIALLLAGIMRKKFPNLLTVISSFLCGLGIDFWVWAIGDRITLPAIPSYILGTLINAFGIAVYLMADALPTAVDYCMLTFCERFHKKVMWGRIITDVVGFIVCLLTKGYQHGLIGVGTIVSLFLMGPLIQLFMNLLAKLRLFGVKEAQEQAEEKNGA